MHLITKQFTPLKRRITGFYFSGGSSRNKIGHQMAHFCNGFYRRRRVFITRFSVYWIGSEKIDMTMRTVEDGRIMCVHNMTACVIKLTSSNLICRFKQRHFYYTNRESRRENLQFMSKAKAINLIKYHTNFGERAAHFHDEFFLLVFITVFIRCTICLAKFISIYILYGRISHIRDLSCPLYKIKL